ncbi:MAG: hypothetical protein AB7K86_11180 [Rhodospirillales bacterium]
MTTTATNTAPVRAFEVHTLQSERWRIDSVFDDRALALFEAKRLEQNARYQSVRVVEEWFDERTNQSRTKAIYEREIRPSAAPAPRGRRPGAPMPRGAMVRTGVGADVAAGAGWAWTAAACMLGIGVAIAAWLALG